MKKYNLFILLFSMFFLIPSVDAKSAVVEFESDNTVEVGNVFTINMVVDNIDSYDGIVSLGGNLSFDKNILKFISSEPITTPYQFHINTEANYKLAGLDFTLDNGIKTRTTVYSFKFEALKEGVAEIDLINEKLTDSQDYLNTSVNSKQIIIKSKSIIQPQIKVEKNEVVQIVEKVEEKHDIEISTIEITNLINKIFNCFRNI